MTKDEAVQKIIKYLRENGDNRQGWARDNFLGGITMDGPLSWSDLVFIAETIKEVKDGPKPGVTAP